MKQVRINTAKVGLVFKNGEYLNVLTKGLYWLGLGKTVLIYDLSNIFNAPIALDILLQDQNLKNMLYVVEVKDAELVLVHENGILKQVLTTGKYAFWKGLINYDFTTIDLSKIYITQAISKTMLAHTLLKPYVRIMEVAAYEKALLLVDDLYIKTLESGTYHFWKNDISITVVKADMRQLQLEISGQELLTKDKAAIRINFYAQYKVTNIEKALLDTKDYEKQLYIALQLSLRIYVGKYTLDELLDEKEKVAIAVLDQMKSMALQLGVSLVNSGIRDVILTGEMKEIMNQVLVAQKRAQANIITRREETASTRSLLNTAKLMEDNAMLFKLKEMEYVENIADKIGEISLSGNGNMINQLKEIFSTNR